MPYQENVGTKGRGKQRLWSSKSAAILAHSPIGRGTSGRHFTSSRLSWLPRDEGLFSRLPKTTPNPQSCVAEERGVAPPPIQFVVWGGGLRAAVGQLHVRHGAEKRLPGQYGQLTRSAMGVEKLQFPRTRQNLGDRKCRGKPRKSFVVHRSAKGFRGILQRKSFSTPTGIYRQSSTR